MYLALDKDNKIIHKNNAPTKQNLSGKQVYHKYDSKIHTIAKFNGTVLPEFWKVVKGFIVEKTLQEKIEDGDIIIPEGIMYDEETEKVRGMTLQEKLTAGQITQAEYDDILWVEIRTQRDGLLRESDWTRLDDAPFDETKKNEWKSYRKDLRDLPDCFSDPSSVVWPTKP